ncbi:hypothetical protein GCM10027416_22660 [Okibacterium endophyticum]
MLKAVAERLELGPGSVSARTEAMNELLTRTHIGMEVAPLDTGFHARISRYEIDDLAVVDCESGAHRGRVLSSLDSGGGPERLGLLIVRQGLEFIHTGSARVPVNAGDAVFWRSGPEGAFSAPGRYSKRTVMMSLSAYAEHPSLRAIESGRKVPAGAGALGLLNGYLDTFVGSFDTLRGESLSTTRGALIQLMAGVALETMGTTKEIFGPSMGEIQAWINMSLGRHDVSARSAAAAHAISIRTMNRIFAAAGTTYSEVVRQRRLANGRMDLINSQDSISKIAFRWGFADGSHFSRAFKDSFGVSPGEYRHRIT